MKRRNRSVEIFSLSALDLFASAMGAFILIAVILMPDYTNVSKVRAEIDALKDSVSDMQQRNEALQRELDEGRTNALLGIVTSANSFVFLIDTSGSMIAYSDRLQSIAAQALAGLTDEQSLQIIGFSGNASNPSLVAWQAPRNLRKMTDDAKLDADRFIQRLAVSFGGTTPTFAALEAGLQYQAEAIVLVTDGDPTDGGGIQSILSRITTANAGAKEIHTIGIGAYAEGSQFRDFLQDLSTRNRGQFMGF
jgi:Mg-chelatase subunit ChlD